MQRVTVFGKSTRGFVGYHNNYGRWEEGHALAELFRDMGEPNWEQIPKMVARLEKQAKDHRITASQIKTVCNELGLGDRVDALIAELKGSGVMSPKLGSLAEVSRAGTPIYELNPSLFTEKGKKKESFARWLMR